MLGGLLLDADVCEVRDRGVYTLCLLVEERVVRCTGEMRGSDMPNA
jgi:hypothetical protein